MVSENVVRALVEKHKSGKKLSNSELQILVDYKAEQTQAITGQTPSSVDVASIPSRYREGFESVATSETRALTAQDELFAKQLGQLGPIAEVQISETPGDTLKARLVNKVYGADSWQFDESGKISVKPKGVDRYLPLPQEGFEGTGQRMLQSAGLTTGAELAGATIGAAAGGGPLGAVIGGSLGAGLGGATSGAKNVLDSIGQAEKLGLLQSGERKAFNETVMQGGAIEGGLSLVFGGLVPVAKGVGSALVGDIAEKSSKAGFNKLTDIPRAIRVESQNLGQETIDFLRRFGAGSDELIESLGFSPKPGELQVGKAALRAEQQSDKLMREFADLEVGAGGTTIQNVVRRFVDDVNARSDTLFDTAIAQVESNIAKGKPVETLDLTKLYGALEKELLSGKTPSERVEAQKFLSELQSNLNLTKNEVASRALPSKAGARLQFSKPGVGIKVRDPNVFGPGATTQTPRIELTGEFDPTKVTARDYAKTKNFIKDELATLENPKFILDKKDKKTITQWLKAFESPFAKGPGTADDLSVALNLGDDASKGNKFLAAIPSKPKQSETFQNIADGYSVRSEGYKQFSPEARKVVLQTDDPAQVTERLFNKPKIAGQVRKIVSDVGTPEEQDLYVKSVRAELFNPSSTAGKKQLQRKTTPGVSQETMMQTATTPEEMRAVQAQGIRLDPELIKQAQLTEGARSAAPSQTILQGSRPASLLSGTDSAVRELLGEEAAQRSLREAQELAGAQITEGIPQSAADIGIANQPGLIEKVLGIVPRVARPAARAGADITELLRNASFAVGGPAASTQLAGYGLRADPINQLLAPPSQRRR